MLRIAVGIIISYIYSLFILPKNEGSEPIIKTNNISYIIQRYGNNSL